MAKRKAPNASELYEFLIQRVDRRTTWGRKAEEVLDGYYRRNNTNALSLLSALVVELQADSLAHVLALDDAFYVRGEKDNCVCGRHTSEEIYLMEYRPGTLAQDEIVSVISTGQPIRGTKDYIHLGSTCHAKLPAILEELGAPGLRNRSKQGPKETEKKLEQMILSVGLRTALEKMGIDPEQMQKIISLEHAQALAAGDESGIRFDLEPGTNRNSYNWFRIGLRAGNIEDNEVRLIWHKLRNAAHLVTESDLATIMVYSYEFRPRSTNVLLAGVKSDLIYLSALSDNHPWIKEHGKVNIDKPYVHPQTRFRSRKELTKRTIRDVITQNYITRVEAMGIHRHFPSIVETRIAINRSIAQRYGLGRTWDYLLGEVGPLFEHVKGELAADYREWGHVVREHILTKKEYLAIKDFLKRGSIGKESERENYLRNYSIKDFEAVAPLITLIGRKIRYARKSGSAENLPAILKQECMLKEDVEERFGQLTGIKATTLPQILEMLQYTYLEHKPFTQFQSERLPHLAAMLEEGFIPSAYLAQDRGSCQLARQYALLQTNGVVSFGDKARAARDYLVALFSHGIIESTTIDMDRLATARYATRTFLDDVCATADHLRKYAQDRVRDIVVQKSRVASLYGKTILSGTESFALHELKEKEVAYSVRGVKYFYVDKVNEYANLTPITPELSQKIRPLMDRQLMNKEGYFLPGDLNRLSNDQILLLPETARNIERLYERVMKKG